jgi:hypothetical protein
MDVSLVVELESRAEKLDKWLEIWSLIEAVYDPASDHKATLADLNHLSGFKASFSNFRIPFKGKRMDDPGTQEESPQLPEYKRTRISAPDAKFYDTTEEEGRPLEERLTSVEQSLDGMEEEFEHMWVVVSSFSRTQQQVMKTLELGVSAGENRVDTIRATLGARPVGLSSKVSAPTLWGTVALVFDELNERMNTLEINSPGLTETAATELIRDHVSCARSDLADIDNLRNLKKGTREALSMVALRFEEIETHDGESGCGIRGPSSHRGATNQNHFVQSGYKNGPVWRNQRVYRG